jgi:TPR repeat protein
METTKYLRKRAKEGDPNAAFRVGYRLAFHRNPRLRNRAAARKYWLQAATQGHIRAAFYLGTLFDSDGATVALRAKAEQWFRIAAEGGHEVAQFNLASLLLEEDRGGAAEAIPWLEEAASNGERNAQHLLGYCYFHGEGTKVDFHLAKLWYRKSAAQGNSRSMYNLGLMHLHGTGFQLSKKRGLAWMERAASLGHRSAKRVLGEHQPTASELSV